MFLECDDFRNYTFPESGDTGDAAAGGDDDNIPEAIGLDNKSAAASEALAFVGVAGVVSTATPNILNVSSIPLSDIFPQKKRRPAGPAFYRPEPGGGGNA